MQIAIDRIKIQNRIREDMGNIDELAESIKKHGLLQPIVITPDDVLIAGERRLKAALKLGATYIEARVMEIKDYEQQLLCEIAENECRKEFTLEERVKYGKELEQIERLKAEERKLSTLKQNANTDKENFPEREKGQVRDIVAAKVGFGSGKQYEKAKTVVDEAPEPIKELAKTGDVSINKAYEATKIINQLPEQEKTKVVELIEQKGKPVVDKVVKTLDVIPSLANKMKTMPEQQLKETIKMLEEADKRNKEEDARIEFVYRIKNVYTDAIEKPAQLRIDQEKIEAYLENETREEIEYKIDRINDAVNNLTKLQNALRDSISRPKLVKGGR